ncbi:hypothetical protein [Chryseobacterium wangxinyae]|uniref:hypothetical protein n=1 Tax=unclassified Chryseobacterium TaxID=2593645 RepID=UPI00226FDE0B|nr:MULTISPECIES: hypothetical protein [unclassified Chryseobacterium]MCY0969260.1 hypothetical protein [Chryseobacterium sp. CY353]WBZ96727.1 hypothetical protein PGH12_06130 [Chryseobacterium sp. CY350]
MQNFDFHRLIPMTSFVIDYYSHEGYADLQTLQLMKNYASFLKQPLSLKMFVPTDHENELLKEPEDYLLWKESSPKFRKEKFSDQQTEQIKLYEKARKKLLFEGFKIAYNGYSVVRIVATYNDSIELSFKKDNLSSQIPADVESLTNFDIIYLSAASLKLIGIRK